jgi:hypothetical protein
VDSDKAAERSQLTEHDRHSRQLSRLHDCVSKQFVANSASIGRILITLLVWADHANEISISYSGTGALKTDFTRTGTRTLKGALQDGYKSLARYIRNNFFDGPRQVGSTLPLCTTLFDLTDRMPLLIDNRPLIIQSVRLLIL